MAQKTSWTGGALTESDINTYLMGEGGAWTSWTPTVTQSGSVTVTVTSATYGRWGRMIVSRMRLTVTGSGTAANAIQIGGLPATSAVAYGVYGQGVLFDATGNSYPFLVRFNSTTTFQLASTISAGGATPFLLGLNDFTSGLAVGDIIDCSITYEAAT